MSAAICDGAAESVERCQGVKREISAIRGSFLEEGVAVGVCERCGK